MALSLPRRALAFVALALPVVLVGQEPKGFPDGTYIARDSRDPRAVTRNAGVEFTFKDGRYEIRRDGEMRVIGRYLVKESRIELTDQEGPWACTIPGTQSAAYVWHMQADELVFKPEGEDTCNRRRNRIPGTTFVIGRAPAPAASVPAPLALGASWKRFWQQSDAPGWVEAMFAADAIAEDGNRKLSGLDQIKGWLGGQDSRNPLAFPFEFTQAATQVIEQGRYRDTFGASDGSTRLLVGRYQITWVPASNGAWKVREWILR